MAIAAETRTDAQIVMTDETAKELPRHWSAIRQHWRILTFYQRFETSLAYLLTFVIGAVIVVALGRLIVSVVNTLVLESLNPLEHSVFQQVFGEIMTLLIALDNKIVARLMPETDPAEAAYLRILSYRKDAWVGDVLSEANEIWEQNS